MEMNQNILKAATTKGIISELQADKLWAFICESQKDTPSFCFTHVLYYLGGLIAIGAMSLFMNLGWERLGGWGLFSTAIVYAFAGLWFTEYFLKRKQLKIPASIMATFVVALTPLAVYGVQAALGWWPANEHYRNYHTHIDWRWIIMELATLVIGMVMFWRYKMTFLVMPIAMTLWYMSMDLTLLLFREPDLTWELRELVSLWFGLVICLLAFWVDIRSQQKKDFAFWLYLFGVLAFWGGLSMMRSNSEFSKFIYLCINLAMVIVGAILTRRVFTIFGGFGIAGYLGHLAYDVFKDSMMFPFILTIIGLGIIYAGVALQRHEKRITTRLRAFLPLTMRELIENRK